MINKTNGVLQRALYSMLSVRRFLRLTASSTSTSTVADKPALRIFGKLYGQPVSGSGWGMRGAIMCGMLVLSPLALGQTNPLVIDSFRYDTSEGAESAWGQKAAGRPVVPVTEAGVSCLSLPNIYSDTSTRGVWERTVELDLSDHSLFSVKLKSSRPSMYIGLSFQTASGGWYEKSFYITDQWLTYVFPTGAFKAKGKVSEGALAGWDNITKIRLSCLKADDSSPATVYVSDLRASISENRLLNSGFEFTTTEAMPDGWGPWLGWGSRAEEWVLDMDAWRAHWSVDRTVNHTPGGSNSLRIVSSTARPAANPLSELRLVSNRSQLNANRTSTLSVWLRSDKANLPVTLEVFGCNPPASTSVTTSSTPDTWERHSLNVSPTAFSGMVQCVIYPTESGTLWVDDVQLEEGKSAAEWRPSLRDSNLAGQSVHKVVPLIDDFVVTPGGNAVTTSVDANGRFLVDGQPFIPMALGWDSDIPSSAMLQHFSQSGFNAIAVLLKPWYKAPTIRAFLDEAKSNGLKVIAWMDRGVTIETMQNWIDDLKDHPSIIMWYVYDEPHTDEQWQEAREKFHLAKTKDPGRAAMINSAIINAGDTSFVYNHTKDWESDVLSTDYYPIGFDGTGHAGTSMGDVGKIVEAMHQTAVNNGKTVWFWVQSMGYAYSRSREPTSAEAECMVYLALIHGSRGIMYFTNMPRTMGLWNEMRILNSEVSTLTPILSSIDTPPTVSADSPSIHLLGKTYNGKQYLIAVNDSPLPVTAELTSLEAGSGSATVLFENRDVSVTNGKIKDTFDGYQRHVYCLAGKESETAEPGPKP